MRPLPTPKNLNLRANDIERTPEAIEGPRGACVAMEKRADRDSGPLHVGKSRRLFIADDDYRDAMARSRRNGSLRGFPRCVMLRPAGADAARQRFSAIP